MEQVVTLLALLAVPSVLSICFLLAANTLQMLNMRLGDRSRLPS